MAAALITNIRAAIQGDVDVIAQYNIDMAKETEDLALIPAVVHAGVAKVLSDRAKGAYFVLEDHVMGIPLRTISRLNTRMRSIRALQVGAQVVGQLMITYEWSDWRNAQCWWIQSVYVHPEHRRRGHYRSLYAHVRKLASDSGASGIRLYADTTNTRAHGTYEALGMISHYKVFEESFTGY